MTKLYQLSYDAQSPTLDADGLHQAITRSTDVSNWAHYHPGCYFMTSNLSATALTDMLQPHFETGHGRVTSFVISEIDTDNLNGSLPTIAWTWLQKRRFEVVGAKSHANLQPAGE
jgi:hypothetical protein